MATIVDRTGTFTLTNANDDISYTKPFDTLTFVDAAGGKDSLRVTFETSGQMEVNADDIFNSGTFFGKVSYGPFDPQLTFINIEEVSVAGGSGNDLFKLRLRSNSSALTATFDGGDGTDTISVDVSELSANFSLTYDGNSITSSRGSFTNFEAFAIYTGSGNDNIVTGDEADTIQTGTGIDNVSSGGGNDRVYTNAVQGEFDLGTGFDSFGGSWETWTSLLVIDINDKISLSSGLTVRGAESFSIGGGGSNTQFRITENVSGQLSGGAGIDSLTYATDDKQPLSVRISGYSTDQLDGSIGSVYFSKLEKVTLTGSFGNDEFRLDGQFIGSAVELDGAGGTDTLFLDFSSLAGSSSFTVGSDGSIKSNRGSYSNFEIINLIGGNDGDVLSLGSRGGYLAGRGGNDTLTGSRGNDTIDGGSGADRMIGGGGNDSYTVDNLSDEIVEVRGGGIDTVYSEVSYVLGSELENLVLFGPTDTDGTGNSLANSITGSGYDNVLSGLGGNDVIDGRAGNDVLLGGAGNDDLRGGDGSDLIVGGQGSDILEGGYFGADIFLFDGPQLGNDRIVDFYDDDFIVTTSALADNDGNGRIDFGRNNAIDLAEGGRVTVFGSDGTRLNAVEFDGSFEIGGKLYFVYSRVGSVAGTAEAQSLFDALI